MFFVLGIYNCAVSSQHDAPVKTVNFVPALNCIMTGSWDRTVKFWDLRQPTPAAAFNLPGSFCFCRLEM